MTKIVKNKRLHQNPDKIGILAKMDKKKVKKVSDVNLITGDIIGT